MILAKSTASTVLDLMRKDTILPVKNPSRYLWIAKCAETEIFVQKVKQRLKRADMEKLKEKIDEER